MPLLLRRLYCKKARQDDPNTYGDEKYIFNLLISIIDLSIRTQDLLDTLPEYKEI